MSDNSECPFIILESQIYCKPFTDLLLLRLFPKKKKWPRGSKSYFMREAKTQTKTNQRPNKTWSVAALLERQAEGGSSPVVTGEDLFECLSYARSLEKPISLPYGHLPSTRLYTLEGSCPFYPQCYTQHLVQYLTRSTCSMKACEWMDEAMHQVIWRLKPVKVEYRQCMPRVYTQNLEMATLPEKWNWTYSARCKSIHPLSRLEDVLLLKMGDPQNHSKVWIQPELGLKSLINEWMVLSFGSRQSVLLGCECGGIYLQFRKKEVEKQNYLVWSPVTDPRDRGPE